MMEILKAVDGLFVTPVSDGADEQNLVLAEELPFKVLEYATGREHNGWIIPEKWEVVKAEIRKDGRLIYDGMKHPLGVIGSSESFKGRVSLEELRRHLFYRKDAPERIVYHCDLYYKPFLKEWGFSAPFQFYQLLTPGEYAVDLETRHSPGTLKVLEYIHAGSLPDTIILNAHNCHAAQINDGPSGYAVLIEVMRRLLKRETRHTYRLVIAPEHIGTVFYLADCDPAEKAQFKQGVFLEMVGHDNPRFALQESFTGEALIDRIAHHVLKFKSRGYWSDRFRKIVGNDETVWEAPGIEVPMISLSRCNSSEFCYPEYHLDSDTIAIIREEQLAETADILMAMIDVFEKNCLLKRTFTGLIALSNPRYDLYRKPGTDPSIPSEERTDIQSRWNHLMNCLPRYCNESVTILDIAVKHELPFDEVYNYLLKFREKGLVEFVFKP